ncbi:MAG: ATP synthase F1 subunit epsilon [Pirellulales bacterium]
MPQLQCIVVTPEETVLETGADFIVVPLFDGELGIGPGHSPLIGRLGYGEMRLRVGEHTSRYYVDGGFVQVAANVVSVLTNRAIPAEKLDAQVVSEQLERARNSRNRGEEAIAARERLVAQYRAQLRVARGKTAALAGSH